MPFIDRKKSITKLAWYSLSEGCCLIERKWRWHRKILSSKTSPLFSGDLKARIHFHLHPSVIQSSETINQFPNHCPCLAFSSVNGRNYCRFMENSFSRTNQRDNHLSLPEFEANLKASGQLDSFSTAIINSFDRYLSFLRFPWKLLTNSRKASYCEPFERLAMRQQISCLKWAKF